MLTVPLLTAFAALLVASITDIRTREVPDLVSWGLVALGSLFAVAASIVTKTWSPVLGSAIGFALGYAVGAGLYYTGQWGGGDAKLLMGLGATIGVPLAWVVSVPQLDLFTFSLRSLPFFIMLVILLVVVGAVYGLAWFAVLAVRKRALFGPAFRDQLKARTAVRVSIMVLAAALLVVALVLDDALTRLLLVFTAALAYLTFYLFIAVRVIESQCMRRQVKAKDLVEGDWVVGSVSVGKRVVIPEKNIGATREHIEYLRKHAPSKVVTIKEGIPFVPSFFIAFIVALLL